MAYYKVTKKQSGGSGGNATYTALDTWIANKYISDTDGSEVSYNGWSATDFLDVSGTSLTVVGLSGTSGQVSYNAFYDTTKAFISNFSFTTQIISIPSTAKYVRFSAPNGGITNNAGYFYT